MPVPAAVPLLDTTGEPPLPFADVEVGAVESFPLIQENAQVGPFTEVKYTYCPLGPFQNAGVLKSDLTVPGGSSCWTLSMSVRFSSPDPLQVRLGSAVYFPIFVVLTTYGRPSLPAPIRAFAPGTSSGPPEPR